MTPNETPEDRTDEQTDDRPEESGSGSTDVKAPFAPHEEDDTAVGDTDQHSDA